MSAVPKEIYRPTLRSLHKLSNATTTQRADVFARRERYPTAVSLPEPKNIIVRLQSGDQVFQLTYPDFGGGLPSWVDVALDSLAERWGEQPGWDSYDAKATDLHCAVHLLQYLFDLLHDGSTPPVITPLSDGGVQAEWHRDHQDLEIVIPAGEPARYYYYNVTTQEEEEQELDHKLEHVSALIAYF